MSSRAMLAGRYELGNRLGRGGMGEVWRAFDTVLRREVAVKTVDLDAAEDAATRERFQREALATASLSHVNVVTVFDAGIDGSTAYLVMELLPGPTLAAIVSTRGALPVDLAIKYAIQAATALAAAHSVGVIHRDVKPGNLMLDSSGHLKMVDFGIARLAQTSAARLTATHSTLGSATYMAPEQARGEAASEVSDVYALGCVLMTLLTGEPPFTAEHPMAVLQQQLHTAPPHVLDRRQDVPDSLDRLVDQMLSKDPSARPRDADSVRVALERLSFDDPAGTAVLATPVDPHGVWAAGGNTPGGVPPTTSTQMIPPAGGRRRSRWPGIALLAALAIVVVIGGLVWLIGAMSDDGTRRAGGGPGPSPTKSTSPSGPSSDPPTSQPTTSAPTTSTDQAVTAAVANLRSAVESLPADDEPQLRAKEKLLDDLDKIEASLDEDSEELTRNVDHFAKTFDDLVEKEEIDESGQDRVAAALENLQELIAE